MAGGKLYKMGWSTLILRCVSEDKTKLVMMEVHRGACGSHIGGRDLAEKILRDGYYWPTLQQGCFEFVNKYIKFQVFAPVIQVPSEVLHSLYSPFHFTSGEITYSVHSLLLPDSPNSWSWLSTILKSGLRQKPKLGYPSRRYNIFIGKISYVDLAYTKSS